MDKEFAGQLLGVHTAGPNTEITFRRRKGSCPTVSIPTADMKAAIPEAAGQRVSVRVTNEGDGDPVRVKIASLIGSVTIYDASAVPSKATRGKAFWMPTARPLTQHLAT